jgi:membrane-associated protease RseP (regulator of RpoE activity)
VASPESAGDTAPPAPRRPSRLWLHFLLLFATLLTSSAAGGRFVQNFKANRPAFTLENDLAALLAVRDLPQLLADGLVFSVPLLLILLAHECGHYFACRRYGLDATLPFFLPAPTFIGTLGAFIRIRSIIFSRRTLFDVGVAGPLAGFAVLLPFLVWGVSLSKQVPGIATQGDLVFESPLLLHWIAQWFFPGVPADDLYLHPIARAAWVGLFATALNLLPIGQLDGGHIIYAMIGDRQQWLSRAAILALIPLGFFYWPWWIWAVVFFFLGRRHPYIHDPRRLNSSRILLGILAFAIFAICFTPAPIRS